ncbi:MAG: D-alanyl-D-alanine carboxypeptidase/D-alanyl-D-alanine-endopeptidase [Flavobacteriaceae bacterium]
MRQFKTIFSFCLIIIFLGACATQPHRRFNKEIGRTLHINNGDNHFTGIFFYDPTSKDTLYRKNSDKYFTPASNTKIYTLFTAIKLLPEKLPVLKYGLNKDTVYISGLGDATQLHPHFKDSTLLHFLKDHKEVVYYPPFFEDEKFGPGWAWEDYDWYYSAERSAMPLYGNVITVHNHPKVLVSPEYFKDSIVNIAYSRNRKPSDNTFFFSGVRKDTMEIPFITSDELSIRLLETALGKSIKKVDSIPVAEKQWVYGMASDSVYKRMMQESDNFLAEQLLIQASGMLSDTLSSGRARQFVLDSLLTDLEQAPRWVDGSGLSRYNLFTPESLVEVLRRMYEEIPRNRLFNLFAVGGESGTLESWYEGNPTPYIYAKTGTLGNNHCLSGYLITASGKTIIFSFMNNHFRIPNTAIKERMQHILEWVRDNY